MIEQLARHKDNLLTVNTLVALWEYFEPAEYARRVLAGRTIRELEISTTTMIKALNSLPSLQRLTCRFGQAWTDYSFLANLPKLHTVRIVLPLGGSPVTVEAPTHLERIVFASRSARAEANHDVTTEVDEELPEELRGGKTLAIVGLDSARILAHLKTEAIFQVQHLIMSGDDRLRDLQQVALPDTLSVLTVDDCHQFGSLAGIEHARLPHLRAIAMERMHKTQLHIDALFATRAGAHPPTMAEQLDIVHVSGIPISDLVHQFGATSFDLETSRGVKATWRRTKESDS